MTNPLWRNNLEENQRIKLVQKASDCIWTPEGKYALDYLMEKRGLSETTIREFQMGFVPLQVKHQLAGRLITPIYDPYGELVALSTRHLWKEKKLSFWHEDFEKSFYLYGLHLAKSHILRTGKAIVVEGELDTSYCHSKGVKIAVGLFGSALSLFHISLLSRYCKQIYLLFDADAGGYSAFQRAKEMYDNYLAGIVDLIPCRMPNGSDPDTFLAANGVKGLTDLMQREEVQFKELGYY